MEQVGRREPGMESQGYLGNSRVILNHFDAATQANIQHTALCYESEDETMGRSRGRHRGCGGTPLYSKQDIREQYCISERGLGALEAQRGGGTGGLFGCLAGAHPTSPCAAAARGSLLTVCVRRRVPSDENIHELCRRQAADYAPMPRHPRYPFGAAPPEVYQYDEDLDCSYFRRRPRSICGGPDPSRYTWLPADEESTRLERPRPIRAELDHRHSAEHLASVYQHGGPICLAHPHPVPLPLPPPPHIAHEQPHRPKHVSFARSHTLTSFDDAVVGIRSTSAASCVSSGGAPGPASGGTSRLARSQERLLDGRKTIEPPPITRQPESCEPPRALMEKLKRAPMKTQATQTEVCLGRKPVPSAQLTLSPRTIHRVRMVSQGAQTNGMLLFNGRKLMKSYSEAGANFTADELEPAIDHEPLQRTQSEEPPRSPFIVKTPSPEPDMEYQPQTLEFVKEPEQQLAHVPPHLPLQVSVHIPVKVPVPIPVQIPVKVPLQIPGKTAVAQNGDETSSVTKSENGSEDSETKSQKEIIIDFEPQIPSSPLKKKPLLKTASDGEILMDKRRAQRHVEDSKLLRDKNLTSVSHDNICIEPEPRAFTPYFQNSPIRHEDIFKDINNGNLIFFSMENESNTISFRAQDSLDEEFHENLISGGWFRKSSSVSDPEGQDSNTRNDSNSPSPEEDGVVPTLHLLPEQRVSPFASSDSLANDFRDHSDGIWNESQATVLQADSGTENGTGLSVSELSSTLSTLSPGSAMLLTPSSRRKHLLMLQHQQRSSMDTDALDEESQAEQSQAQAAQTSPCSPRMAKETHVISLLPPPKSATKEQQSTPKPLRRFPTSPSRSRRFPEQPKTALSDSALDQRMGNGSAVAVVPNLLLARTDSGRTNTDVSESTTTDDYITANSGTDSSRRSGSFKGGSDRHHPQPVTQDGSSFESASSIYSITRGDLIGDDMVVPSFSPPPILEELSDSAVTPVPMAHLTVGRPVSPSGSSSSSGSYSLDGGSCPDLARRRTATSSATVPSSSAPSQTSATAASQRPPVPSPRHVPSISDDERSVHYSSSGYYESPLEDDSATKTPRKPVDHREWTDEEKRKRKRGFTLEITKHQSTEDQNALSADKIISPNADLVPVQSSPRTEKPKRTKVRTRSPMQGGRRGTHAPQPAKRSPTTAATISTTISTYPVVRTPTKQEDWEPRTTSAPIDDVHSTATVATSDDSSSGVCGDVQILAPSQTSPRKVRKIRDNNRRKSTPRSPTNSRSKRRNGSGDDKASSLPGSLPRRRTKHDSGDDSHSNTLNAKSNRLSPYKSPGGSPSKRKSTKITSPESARLKALSAESLRSVSPGSDSVFYSDPSSHANAPTHTEHQVHCLHCGKEVDIVTTDDPDKSASSNGQQPDIVQPPASFADSPRQKHGRLYKKLEKRFRSEDRAHEKRHHKYRPDVRAKSEERGKEDTPRVKLRPMARSTDNSLEQLRATGSSPSLLAGSPEAEDDCGLYMEPYNRAAWIYIGDQEEAQTWNKSDPVLNTAGSEDTEIGRRESAVSMTSTDSEHDFKKRYQAITHRMVHRKSCLEMYKRQASKSFAADLNIDDNDSLRRSLEELLKLLLMVWCKENQANKLISSKPNESDKTIVVRRESGEFGFRIHGSKPVVVSAIEPDTPAESSGLEVGDIVLAVNGVSVLDKSHSEVVKIAHAGSDTLTLEVARTCGVLSPPSSGGQDSTSLNAGYLWKQGGHVSGNPTNKWIRRWFCLKKDNCLYSYKTDMDNQPVGAMMLINYDIERCDDDEEGVPAKPFRFSLRKSGVPTLHLAADTEAAASRWQTVLSHAAERTRQADTWLEQTRKNLSMSPSTLHKPDCFGYLNKLGSKWKTWSRRYCVLKDACMFFYQDANSKCSYGMACLHGYRVQQSTLGGKKHAFEILPTDSSQKHFYFHTESEMDRKRWLAALEYSIDRWLKVG